MSTKSTAYRARSSSARSSACTTGFHTASAVPPPRRYPVPASRWSPSKSHSIRSRMVGHLANASPLVGNRVTIDSIASATSAAMIGRIFSLSEYGGGRIPAHTCATSARAPGTPAISCLTAITSSSGARCRAASRVSTSRRNREHASLIEARRFRVSSRCSSTCPSASALFRHPLYASTVLSRASCVAVSSRRTSARPSSRAVSSACAEILATLSTVRRAYSAFLRPASRARASIICHSASVSRKPRFRLRGSAIGMSRVRLSDAVSLIRLHAVYGAFTRRLRCVREAVPRHLEGLYARAQDAPDTRL